MMLALPLFSQAASNSPLIVLQVLQAQQSALTAELAAAQQQSREAQVNFEITGNADKASARVAVGQAEAQVAEIRQRLSRVRDQILDAQRDVGVTTGTVGVPVAGQEQWRIFGLKPAEFYSALGFVLWFPVMLAFARRIWRSGPARSRRDEVVEGNPQITRLEQAVESIAIEVERIGEAQRFSAKLLSERPVQPVREDASPRRAKRPVITPVP